MIGVVASFKAQKNLFVSDIKNLDSMPRMSFLKYKIWYNRTKNYSSFLNHSLLKLLNNMIRKVFFEKIKGKEVFCYLAEPEKSNKKIIIMSHGFRSSSVGPARTFVNFERKLLQKGYSVFRFDQPSSGTVREIFFNHLLKNGQKQSLFWRKNF